MANNLTETTWSNLDVEEVLLEKSFSKTSIRDKVNIKSTAPMIQGDEKTDSVLLGNDF